ncbi:hypothetical protein [Oceaniglobus roseus]|uniref:hypothetical protein n=1 Tax=Oceaniglobus roseus TaxID=1737570 RepID=UPI000C7F11E0|nr:hypothetical protein [Kandeliimicrobium roseum]
MTNQLTRRAVLSALPVSGAAMALPAIASPARYLPASDADSILVHMRAIHAALRTDLPNGFEVSRTFSVIDETLLAAAFPPAYQYGDPMMHYDLGRSTWVEGR